MQRVDLLSIIFTRCGAKCGECSEGNLEVIVPLRGGFDHFFSGVIDSRLSLLDIAYGLEDIFDVDFRIERYGESVYDEHFDVFSPLSISELRDESIRLSKSAKQLAYDDFREFAHRIEQSLTRLSLLLKVDDLDWSMLDFK